MTTERDDARTARVETEVDGDLHYVTQTDGLEEGDRVIVDVDGREIAVFRIDDEFYALLNYCVHQGGPGCEGRIAGTLVEHEDGSLGYERDNEIVACPWHGWEYDIKTGQHLSRPEYRVPSYEVLEEDGDIYVVV